MLDKIGWHLKLALNDEESELKKTAKKLEKTLNLLSWIKDDEREFNHATSTKKKQICLQNLQKRLQELAEIRKLTTTETQIQQRVSQNIRLMQQGKNTEKFTLINERQRELELLSLEKEENYSTNESINEEKD